MAGRPLRRLRANGAITPMDGADLRAKAQETLSNGAPRYYFHLGSLAGARRSETFCSRRSRTGRRPWASTCSR